MSDLLQGLNPQQREAVSARPNSTLVIAGPGSGKTAVLTRRVAYLIREMNIAPFRIIAVTFTNKAAHEMQERIAKLLGGKPHGLIVGTFHAVCARILRREAASIGLRADYVIYDTDDQLAVMQEAIAEAGLNSEKPQIRRFLSLISNAKNELIGVEDYPDGTPADRQVRQLYQSYQKRLRANNALDFDDLILQTVLLFRHNPDVLRRYQENYTHILVDEFQDTNTAQYVLVRLLAGSSGSLFCVGDPDQSIYRFRGADYRNLDRFRNDYPDAQLIILEQNYRSHQIILDTAMAIIDKNTGRIPKRLTTSRTDGQKVILKNLTDEEDEARYVVWTIRDYQLTGRYSLRDCAVMYRTNAQSRSFEETFIRANIPYRLVGGTRFYGRKEIKDLLAYLRLVQNPEDSVSLKRIINVPPRGVGKTTLTKLEDWAASRNQSLFDAIQAIASGEESPLTGKPARALADFALLIGNWRRMKDTVPVGELLSDVLDRTRYVDHLDDGTPEGRERVENVRELFSVVMGLGERKLAEYLEEIALVADVDNLDENADGPVLLTLHAAKGLEFPVVFIVGLEEGLLPYTQALEDEEQMAEERRLMYVGVTRAKDLLHLTWVKRRSIHGTMGERARASRFLLEIPADLTVGSLVSLHAESGTYDYSYRRPITLPRQFYSANVSSLYRAGQRVRHERYGEGEIVSSRIRGGEEEIVIRFGPPFGIRQVISSITPLVLIEDEE